MRFLPGILGAATFAFFAWFAYRLYGVPCNDADCRMARGLLSFIAGIFWG